MKELDIIKFKQLIDEHLAKMDTSQIRKRAPKGYVTLSNGRLCKRENMIELNGFKYDKTSSDIFVYNGNFYHTSDTKFTTDDVSKLRVLKSDVREVVVGFKENKEPIYGRTAINKPFYLASDLGKHSERDHYAIARSDKYGELRSYDSKIFLDAGYVEAKDGMYYDNINIAKDINGKYKPEKTVYLQCNNPFKNFIKTASKNELIQLGIESPTTIATNGLKYTFGVEIETSGGRIPMHKLIEGKLNFNSEYDGSLKDDEGKLYGGEYISGILKGDAGMIQINKMVKLLQEYTCINKKCSVHVHIGNAKFDKQFVVSSYMLGQRIEQDLFRMLPNSRAANEYCKHMGTIDFKSMYTKYEFDDFVNVAYNHLYVRFLSGKKPLGKIGDRTKNHPGGRTCNHDKGTDRYCWMNLIPSVFNTREAKGKDIPHTIEYRAHAATLNYTKIKNWILICMALTNYAENNIHTIISKNSISLEEVITNVYGNNKKICNTLLEYVKERKKLFSSDSSAESKEYADKTNVEYKNKKDLLCA